VTGYRLFSRRVAAVLLILTACRGAGIRCAYCGMKIEATSPWRCAFELANGLRLEYDSPRCALLAWRTGEVTPRALLVQDYYDRSWRRGDEVLFVASSDVTGPMGADLVPVDMARAQQFAREHTGTRPLALTELSVELLRDLH
jgi:hypothetical protein